jgi:hypothetical protein
MNRLVEAKFQERRHCPRSLPVSKCLLELPDDLILTNNHGVDPGRKREEVPEGALSFMEVKAAPPRLAEELVERFAVTINHHFDTVTCLEKEDPAKPFSGLLQEFPFIRKPEFLQCHDVSGMVAEPGSRKPGSGISHAGTSLRYLTKPAQGMYRVRPRPTGR